MQPLPIISIRPQEASNFRGKLTAAAAPLFDSLFALNKLNRIYHQARNSAVDIDFAQSVLDQLRIRIEVAENDLERIPQTGPVIVAANHPFGLLDPLILYTILRKVRPDVKVIANDLLARIPEAHEFCIFVNPFGKKEGTRANTKPLRKTIEWLAGGGMIVVFPAGEVAALKARELRVSEPNWSPTVSRLIDKTPSAVLPVYFKGTNKPGFHVSGLIHPRLRTALLPREFLNKRDCKIELAIGHAIPESRVRTIESHSNRMEFLRARVFNLKNRWRQSHHSASAMHVDREPVAAARPVIAYLDDLRSLPESCRLIESNQISVFCAEANQLPNILHEIGRQREISFREVGEGTGRAIDLDRYDRHYLHLFAWNHDNNSLVGAYRIGQIDKLLAAYGSEGLYTQSLFRIHQTLLQQISPALELGRSFVTPEYRRTRFALAMLWKGLARFVVQNPQYPRLFGPVSISNEYHTMSHLLMMAFLREYYYLSEESRLVSPRIGHPLTDSRHHRLARTMLKSDKMEDLFSMISDIEWDGKGIPVLIREYLKLGGRILGFNIDSKFSNVMDALILVDLRRTERKVLNWYMGKEGAAEFLEYHARKDNRSGLIAA